MKMDAVNSPTTRDLTNQAFTAAAIARALGCSKQNVHQRLDCTTADTELMINGNLAKAWRRIREYSRMRNPQTISGSLLVRPLRTQQHMRKAYDDECDYGQGRRCDLLQGLG